MLNFADLGVWNRWPTQTHGFNLCTVLIIPEVASAETQTLGVFFSLLSSMYTLECWLQGNKSDWTGLYARGVIGLAGVEYRGGEGVWFGTRRASFPGQRWRRG